MQNRIDSSMKIIDGLVAMAEGNPGAITAMSELMGSKDALAQFSEGYMDICRLDDMHIYGALIWLGYKDVCKFDVKKFRKMIRDGSIKEAIKSSDRYKAREKMLNRGGVI